MVVYSVLYYSNNMGAILGRYLNSFFQFKTRLYFLHSLSCNSLYIHCWDNTRVNCHARLLSELLFLAGCHKHFYHILRCRLDPKLHFWNLVCKWNIYWGFYNMSLKGLKNWLKSSLINKGHLIDQIDLNFKAIQTNRHHQQEVQDCCRSWHIHSQSWPLNETVKKPSQSTNLYSTRSRELTTVIANFWLANGITRIIENLNKRFFQRKKR